MEIKIKDTPMKRAGKDFDTRIPEFIGVTDYYNVLSGFPDMPADCFPSPFLCYKPVDGIMTPTMRSYKPRVRLMGNGKYSRAQL